MSVRNVQYLKPIWIWVMSIIQYFWQNKKTHYKLGRARIMRSQLEKQVNKYIYRLIRAVSLLTLYLQCTCCFMTNSYHMSRVWFSGTVNYTEISNKANMDNLKMPIILQSMSLDQGRKHRRKPLRHRENIQTHTCSRDGNRGPNPGGVHQTC